MAKLNWTGAVVLLSALALASASSAGAAGSPGDFSFMTLHGLGKLAVEVRGVHRDFVRYGLDAAAVKSAVEAKLRNGGITVVDMDAARSMPDAALMRISLNANEDQMKFYFYGISLEIRQKIPVNEAGGFISQNIWSSGRTGVIDPTNLARMNGYIADLVDLFLQDYRDQNRPSVSAVP